MTLSHTQQRFQKTVCWIIAKNSNDIIVISKEKLNYHLLFFALQ